MNACIVVVVCQKNGGGKENERVVVHLFQFFDCDVTAIRSPTIISPIEKIKHMPNYLSKLRITNAHTDKIRNLQCNT